MPPALTEHPLNRARPATAATVGPLGQLSEATRLQALIVGASHPKPMIVRE